MLNTYKLTFKDAMSQESKNKLSTNLLKLNLGLYDFTDKKEQIVEIGLLTGNIKKEVF